jgi:ribonucleoside-diphosphate reductase alpha chain
MYTKDEVKKASIDFFGGDELAANVFADKYAVCNSDGMYEEKTPDDMWNRMATAGAAVEKDKSFWQKEFLRIFSDFKAVPQGSIMFSLGNKYSKSSCSNCFVLEITEDSIDGIFNAAKDMANTYKFRGGCGIDLGVLRPQNARVSNAAKTSTGAASFMEFYSQITNIIGMHGRRGALMLTMPVTHPDIASFITAKHQKDRVTGANISVKITDDFMKAVENNSDWVMSFKTKHEDITKKIPARELWKTIVESATNTAEPGLLFWDNIIKNSPSDCYGDLGYKSVSTNPCQPGFALLLKKTGVCEMSGVNIGDEIWSETGWTKVVNKWSTGIKPVYKYKTDGWSEFLNDIAHFIGTENHRAVSNGEKIEISKLKTIDFFNDDSPNGETFDMKLMNTDIVGSEYLGDFEVFDITVDNHTHTYWTGGVNVSNCSELPLENLGACTLLSMNIAKYTRNNFKENSFFDEKSFFDDVCIATRFLDNVKTIDADLMPLEGQRKHALESRRIGMGIHGLADTLASLGIKYDSNAGVDFIDKFFEKYTKCVYSASVELGKEKGVFPIFDAKREIGHPFLERIGFAGKARRNIACMTLAPTGSVSIVSQTSSGIEPVFRNTYTRRVRYIDGKKLSDGQSVVTDSIGNKWIEYSVNHHNVSKFIKENPSVKLPDYFVTSDKIDWKKRVAIQSKITNWLDHSVSSTINLPKGTSSKLVSDIYFEAWRRGCKGITVYVDGCRDGVLISGDVEEINKENKCSSDAAKRPKKLPCDLFKIQAEGQKWIVVVGKNNEKPYEVFAGRPTKMDIPDGEHAGYIEKDGNKDDGRGIYSLHVAGEKIVDLPSVLTDAQKSATRQISLSLRHGVPIKYIVQQLEKSDGSMASFEKAIARVLKKYIKDGEVENGSICNNCKQKTLVRQEGCVVCSSCGWTKCS